MTKDQFQELSTAYLRQAAAARHAMEDPEAPSGDAARDPVLRAGAAAHALQRLEERFTRLDEVLEKAERAVDAAAAVAVAQEAEAPAVVLERLQLEQREKQFAFKRSVNDVVTGDSDLPTILTAYAKLATIAAGDAAGGVTP